MKDSLYMVQMALKDTGWLKTVCFAYIPSEDSDGVCMHGGRMRGMPDNT